MRRGPYRRKPPGEDVGTLRLELRPIVNTPEDAYRCFMFTDMDALVLENCVLLKEDQPPMPGADEYRRKFDKAD